LQRFIYHRAETDSKNRVYWDNGPVAIQRFIEHHLRVCSENVVCNRLGLRALKYDLPVDSDEEARPQTPPSVQSGVIRNRPSTHSPQRKRQKRGPLRIGTLNSLLTVEAFLTLNDLSRVSVGGE
jgi:hypothetical protein